MIVSLVLFSVENIPITINRTKQEQFNLTHELIHGSGFWV